MGGLGIKGTENGATDGGGCEIKGESSCFVFKMGDTRACEDADGNFMEEEERDKIRLCWRADSNGHKRDTQEEGPFSRKTEDMRRKSR